jgi:hypothetical protein
VLLCNELNGQGHCEYGVYQLKYGLRVVASGFKVGT